MFTKTYLTIELFCAVTKNAQIFLWHFDGNSLSFVVSLFSSKKLCVFVSVVPFQLVKIVNWFSFKCFV